MNRSHVCFGSGTGTGVVTAGGAGALYTKCFSVASKAYGKSVRSNRDTTGGARKLAAHVRSDGLVGNGNGGRPGSVVRTAKMSRGSSTEGDGDRPALPAP
jgi:hypothetical protein